MAIVTDKDKRALVLSFEDIMVGKKKQFSSYYFSGNAQRDSDIAIELLRYFFQDIMNWDAQMMEQNVKLEFLKKYKLDKFIHNYIYFVNEPNGKVRYKTPDADENDEEADSSKSTGKKKNNKTANTIKKNKEIDFADIQQLIQYIYKDYKIDLRAITIAKYDELIAGEIKKFPKHFFDINAKGRVKACICLQHAISSHHTFSTIEELYSIFGDKNILKLLSQWRLKDVSQQFYKTPLEYLHDALPDENKDEELFELYSEKYREVLKETGRSF